jgi:hypothetical protein
MKVSNDRLINLFNLAISKEAIKKKFIITLKYRKKEEQIYFRNSFYIQ